MAIRVGRNHKGFKESYSNSCFYLRLIQLTFILWQLFATYGCDSECYWLTLNKPHYTTNTIIKLSAHLCKYEGCSFLGGFFPICFNLDFCWLPGHITFPLPFNKTHYYHCESH